MREENVKIFKKLGLLKELSGAVGIVFMGGIEFPEFISLVSDFLNKSNLIEDSIDPLLF